MPSNSQGLNEGLDMNLLAEIKELAFANGINAKFEQLFANNAEAVQVILPSKRLPDFKVMAALKPSSATAKPTGLGVFTVQRPLNITQ